MTFSRLSLTVLKIMLLPSTWLSIFAKRTISCKRTKLSPTSIYILKIPKQMDGTFPFQTTKENLSSVRNLQKIKIYWKQYHAFPLVLFIIDSIFFIYQIIANNFGHTICLLEVQIAYLRYGQLLLNFCFQITLKPLHNPVYCMQSTLLSLTSQTRANYINNHFH